MKNVKYIGIIGVFVGMVLSKILGNYFGNDSRIILMLFAMMCVFVVIICLVLKKKYFGAIIMLAMLSPLIVSFLGIYLNNLYLESSGLILFFIVLIIIIKYLNKKNKSV